MQNTPPAVWAQAIVWLYGTFIIFWLVQFWLGKHIQGLALLIFRRPHAASSIYFWLLAPGVMLHELSHWLMAKLLFVPTRDIVLFRPNRNRTADDAPVTLGYVEIFKTDPVRQSLIGLAPLPAGIIVLLLLAAILNFSTGVNSLTASDQTWQALQRLPGNLAEAVRQPLNWLWLYLVFSVSTGMLPSKPDRRPWLIGFILPGTLLLLLAVLGYFPTLPTDWQLGLRQMLGSLTWIFAFAAVINGALALIIFLLELVLSKAMRRRVVYK
jgi:hypothetical protein